MKPAKQFLVNIVINMTKKFKERQMITELISKNVIIIPKYL